MADIPRAVLSEHLQARMEGRRLIAAVFLTYKFDPAFFEAEILPVFLDVAASVAPPIRLLQLEEGLRSVPEGIAVYYDQNGLVSESGGAKLDFRRIPIRHRNGIFHAKNVLLLVETAGENEGDPPVRSLLVSCLSANLTRSGWWSNVEVCHTEEIEEGGFTRLKEDLLGFLDGLERRTAERAGDEPGPLRAIRAFLRGTEMRQTRSTGRSLHTHFYAGRGSIADFLAESTRGALRGMRLEVISPYFDKAEDSESLNRLIELFEPKEVRLFLPRKASGEALCEPEFYQAIGDDDRISWARLPKRVVQAGKADDAPARFVHAKVYRFFDPREKRELLFVGSANLTSAAHSSGGNVETGFLVEVECSGRLDWWLEVDGSRPQSFAPDSEGEDPAASGGTALSIRYWWDRGLAEAYWDENTDAPALRLEMAGVEIGRLDGLPSRSWTPLAPEVSSDLGERLRSTSILKVYAQGIAPGLLLVQEEHMSHRPSLLLDLSPAEILRYWSLLTVEQRIAFIEARASHLALTGEGAALLTRVERLQEKETLFDRFAGVFHAFSCLEQHVREALDRGKEKDAVYRLFGQKYDSLGNLLERVWSNDADGKGDPVEAYVIGLCARQVLNELKAEHPGFWAAHVEDVRQVEDRLRRVTDLRGRIEAKDPDRMPKFLDWFEKRFLRKAEPVGAEAP